MNLQKVRWSKMQSLMMCGRTVSFYGPGFRFGSCCCRNCVFVSSLGRSEKEVESFEKSYSRRIYWKCEELEWEDWLSGCHDQYDSAIAAWLTNLERELFAKCHNGYNEQLTMTGQQ